MDNKSNKKTKETDRKVAEAALLLKRYSYEKLMDGLRLEHCLSFMK